MAGPPSTCSPKRVPSPHPPPSTPRPHTQNTELGGRCGRICAGPARGRGPTPDPVHRGCPGSLAIRGALDQNRHSALAEREAGAACCYGGIRGKAGGDDLSPARPEYSAISRQAGACQARTTETATARDRRPAGAGDVIYLFSRRGPGGGPRLRVLSAGRRGRQYTSGPGAGAHVISRQYFAAQRTTPTCRAPERARRRGRSAEPLRNPLPAPARPPPPPRRPTPPPPTPDACGWAPGSTPRGAAPPPPARAAGSRAARGTRRGRGP